MKGEIAKKWLGRLTKLNPASGGGKCRGKAPHKPLLLLCLIDMAEAGELAGRTLQPYAGRLLQFAAGVALRPKPDYFTWHRSVHGFGVDSF